MIIFIVGSKFCTQILQMGMRFSLLDMLLLYWAVEECPEKKTRAGFPFRIFVEFKWGSRLLQGGARTCRSLTTETNNRNSLNSCSASKAPHVDHLQQLTAKFGAVNIELYMVLPLGSALRDWSLYSLSPIQNRIAERHKHMQVPTSAVRNFDAEIIRHASLTWHKIKCSLTLLDCGSPFSHQIIPMLFLPKFVLPYLLLWWYQRGGYPYACSPWYN